LNNQKAYQIEQMSSNTKKYEDQLRKEQEDLAMKRTEFEIKKAIQDPEILEIANYVDSHWGTGSFEGAVWRAGEEMQNKKQVITFEDIPRIAKEVAGNFNKFRAPAVKPNVEPTQEKKQVVRTKVVANNTESLPNISGEQGVPIKTKYKDGSGIDGLRNRYKDINGDEL